MEIHTVGHYGFVPYKVELDSEVMNGSKRGRQSYIFTPEAIDLLKSNRGSYFVIHESKLVPEEITGKVDRAKIMSQRSTYYAAAKYASNSIDGLEFTVRGTTDKESGEHTVKLIARIND
jgi:hypothetical protein